MTDPDKHPNSPGRRALLSTGASLMGTQMAAGAPNAAAAPGAEGPTAAPQEPPAGYNILFILVDQEHFFDRWPFPVPGREWIKQNGARNEALDVSVYNLALAHQLGLHKWSRLDWKRLRDKLSNESLADRIARMLAQVERAADEGTAHTGARPAVRTKRAGSAALTALPVAPSAAMLAPETATDGVAAEQERLDSVRAALAFSPGNAARDADAKARTARRPRKVSRPLPPL